MKKLISILLLTSLSFLLLFRSHAATDIVNDGTLGTSLVACWELNEESGTRADSKGSNTLTDNNTVLFATGIQGNAGDFERGTTEYLSITDNTDLSVSDADFSFTAWFQMESDPAGTDYHIIGKFRDSDSNREYRVFIQDPSAGDTTDERVVFAVSSNGSAAASVTATDFGNLSTGTWYMVYVSHDATGNLLSISINDGTVTTAAYSSGVFDGASPFQLGARITTSDAHDGLIDVVAFWKKKLTSGEITSLYASGVGIPCVGAGGGAAAPDVPLIDWLFHAF